MQLLRHRELSESSLVELLRVSSEFLIYSDQHSAQQFFFEYFCEKNMLALFVQIGEASPPHRVQVQLLQTLSLLVQNITTATSLYYILSNNYINRLMTNRHFQLDQEDVRDWYVTFLKALSIRLNVDTVQFFFNASTRTFPLYLEALKFRNSSEIQVQIAVKTVLLNVLRVPDERMRRFLTHRQNMPYFMELVDQGQVLALKMQGLLNTVPFSHEDKLHYVIDATIDHWYYLQDILDVPMPDLSFQLGEWIFESYLRTFVAPSLLPNCLPSAQRVSTILALFLLLQFFQCVAHTPLLNAATFMLFHPEAEECSYMSAALGTGERKSVQLPRSPSFNSTLDGPSPRHVDLPTPTLSMDTPTQPIPQSLSCDSLRFRDGRLLLSPTASQSLTSPRFVLPLHKLPTPTFQPHNKDGACTAGCYLVTRYAVGEWPVDDIVAASIVGNRFRQSLLALLQSSDLHLRLAATALLLTIASNKNIDRSLLKDCQLIAHDTTASIGSRETKLDDDDASSSDDDDEQIARTHMDVYFTEAVDHLLATLEETSTSLLHVRVSLHLVQELAHGRRPLLSPTHQARLHAIRRDWAAQPPADDIAVWERHLSRLSIGERISIEWPAVSPFTNYVQDGPSVENYLALHETMAALQLVPPLPPLVDAFLAHEQTETTALVQAYQSHAIISLAEISFLPCAPMHRPDDALFCLLNVDQFILVRPERDMTCGQVHLLAPYHATAATPDSRDPCAVHVTAGTHFPRVSLLFQSPEMADQARLHLSKMKSRQEDRKRRAIQEVLVGFI
ncbi:Aste57867_19097 [Aphanomyces stellatus]|uniref:Aste57867_19097 protein n=1 Tax=Aphanomyces stellatus TaxID=120398 RepID=A0A485LC22_9STRA|nr:hypothetical protein As57867_019033 [Aphanomyces stellatus]VFT95822.1 Aste57867_19097 [Aphanomyces stellatus]